MRSFEFVTVDVFTTQRFGGNPLAVVLDAAGLETAEMQALAAEFNYSETTFVLPPEDPAHTARVRIFNRRNEMDFAGHPNVGTALVLAAQRRGERFTFEERAGLVVVDLDRDAQGRATSARVQAPQPLSVLAALPVDAVGACLGLAPDDVAGAHEPVVASVGTTFGLVPVRAGALERIATRTEAFAALVARFPRLKGRLSLFVYADASADDEPGAAPGAAPGVAPAAAPSTRPHAIDARMFAPLDGTAEDPATGSAAAALAAYRLSLGDAETLQLRVRQGVKMGRPSLIVADAWREAANPAPRIRASVSGGCVEVFRGRMTL